MKLLKNIEEISESPKEVILTIGNYDGVHLGHQKIIAEMKESSRQKNLPLCVLTFSPHPRTVVKTDAPVKLITVSEEKADLMEELGVDFLIEQPFSREFSNMSPDDFFQKWLFTKIQPLELHLGKDFRFGKDQKGDLECLKKLSKKHQFKLNIVDDLTVQTEEGELKVSSTEVRHQLSLGNMKAANSLLGYNFFAKGTVIQGQGRGKSIGIPTANLLLRPKLLPKTGVYATQVTSLIENIPLKSHPAVSNIGFNPTFENRTDLSLETHILDWKESIYGVRVKIEFLERLRDEIRFSKVDELVRQIHSDIMEARELFASR